MSIKYKVPGSAVGAMSGLLDREKWMAEALGEAERALEHGDVPVGAVVVAGGEIIASRHNERELQSNPTAHAEILALQDAAKQLGSWRLPSGASLITTLEPCPMCAGAAWSARVGEVVFGAPDPKAGACGSLYNIGVDSRLNHQFEVIGGVLEAECAALLKKFFRPRRSKRN